MKCASSVNPTNDSEKGALMQTLRRWLRGLRAVSPGALPPADGVPMGWPVPTQQEARPALLHPPRPTCAVGLRGAASRWTAAHRARPTASLGRSDLRQPEAAVLLARGRHGRAGCDCCDDSGGPYCACPVPLGGGFRGRRVVRALHVCAPVAIAGAAGGARLAAGSPARPSGRG